LKVCLGGLDLHEHLSLVVAGAAGIDGPVAARRLKRLTVPLHERVGRLHVVVAVHEDRRLILTGDVLGIDNGVAVSDDDLAFVHPDLVEVVGQPLGRAVHVVGVGRVGADGGDAQEVFELADKSVEAVFGVGKSGVHEWRGGRGLFRRATRLSQCERVNQGR
jgi:hypothetical protein